MVVILCAWSVTESFVCVGITLFVIVPRLLLLDLPVITFLRFSAESSTLTFDGRHIERSISVLALVVGLV
jgi:hypothetical protein